ncbi:GH1 family beta-glucosidase [soil metagenome]
MSADFDRREFDRADFGTDFTWGVATASYQIEGAWDTDGKGPSIWDTFTHGRALGGLRSRIKDDSTGDVACDFYHRYPEDLALVPQMGFGAKRFSISWSRVLPEGTGRINQAGLDFYSRVVDRCLELGVEPWVTLYHWDLPQALQDKGGWANRDVVQWFGEYVGVVADALGDRVRNWMVFNEPLSFVLVGNLLGEHAPGHRSRSKFLASMHHVNLAQAEAARVLRDRATDPVVGTTHYLADIAPTGTTSAHQRAVTAADAFINRAYLEPNLGLGYPLEDCVFLSPIEKYQRPGDEDDIQVDWDFLGVQYYTRLLAKLAPIPGIWTVPTFGRDHRNFDITATGWEVNPTGLHDVIMAMHAYGRFPRLVVTENGAAYPDELLGDPTDTSGTADLRVIDRRRIWFYEQHLAQVLRAQRDGAPVDGYFAWSLMDNFEWADGYGPRFGLVYVDYPTQRRVVKDSGRWFQRLLTGD